MNWASEHNIPSLPWRTVCILFESRCRLMATISIGANVVLRPNNTVPWATNLETTEASLVMGDPNVSPRKILSRRLIFQGGQGLSG